MFDYQISKQPHYESACRAFAIKHNLTQLAKQAGMRPQVLRNKLNPDQPHQLTVPEILLLTDLTEDPGLMDGMLAQLHCLPCVPLNEVAPEKLPFYVMNATAEVGQVAAGAVSQERLTQNNKRLVVEGVNAGMRFLALAALSVDARLKANPAMASAIDTVTGLGASFI